MGFSVTRASPAHRDIIALFNQRMAEETEDKVLPTETINKGVAALLDDERKGFYLVAIEDDAVIGCLAITYEWSDWRNGLFWWIQSVYVAAEHRGKGVFSAMYAEVKRLASSDATACGIRLYVERDNSTAQATYQKLGMIETDYRIMEEEFPAGD